MKEIVQKLIARFFGTESVDDVLTTFNRTVTRLERAAAKHVLQAFDKEGRAQKLRAEVAAHDDQSRRARNVIGRIKAIVE